jgi:hypothetical protein
MNRYTSLLLIALAVAGSVVAQGENAKPAAEPDWALNATLIEACSCPMFCQCFFTDQPAAHHDHATGKVKHFCEGNIAFHVNRGNYGATKLDGIQFWMTGDLGDKLSDGLEWGIMTFDPSVTPEQRQAVGAIMAHVYPFPVKDPRFGKDAAIEWKVDKDRAMAKLDAGKAAEIHLKRFQGNTDDPVVIKNLRYVGAPRNDGFVLMPNEFHTYRLGEKAFEHRNTNGFVVTIDITSKDVMPKPAG